jgi:hypothetical protein
MNKTLHKKLTEKYCYEHTPILARVDYEDMPNGFSNEMGMLHHAAKDLLQPRPEAVSRILQMARDL